MATKTLLFTHPACAGHDMGEGHPEQPARLAAVLSALEGPDFQELERREAPETTRDRILLMHPPAYVDGLIAAFPTEGRVQIDADTAVSAGSREAAFRAVGGVVARLVITRNLTRPWAFACSIISQSGPPMRGMSTIYNVSL